MDTIEARFACLKLAAESSKVGSDKILETAKDWAEFVIGPKVPSSASFGKKGADDPKN